MAVQWAPLSLPLPRRRQTASVLLWMLLIPISFAIFFYFLFTPKFTPLALAYVVFIILDPSPETGARRVMWMRKLPIWRWCKDYFPIQLVSMAELDPSRNYLFGYHPHGIIALGSFLNFGTEASSFSHKFPGLNIRLMTLQTNFNLPLWREVLLSLGISSVSRRSCDNILNKGPGHSCMIVVGGATESLHAFPGIADLIVRKRLGFIKVALRNGADLVPVYSFGENDLWDQVPNPPGSAVRTMQALFQKYMTFAPPLFFGRGVFNYSFGIMPYRRAVVSVVGRPIECPKIENPSQEILLEYQQKYLDELMHIWDTYKDKYAKNRKREMRFLE
ncbi:diacylglycerol acyltransferase [Fimicolochytrium jonesii]|uniref:diacylglycerol acyltransferase n=1 Tax=Fimicolochytrium jonesii TaxID=1396493 RepID=UPI0022FE2575|nr:diacylglycerol acyltransferase [Fimicolochytrium jonesii]KAI8819413.1 diacylglycerol acyltransferase [Fimicolochytrium jonesii]